MTKRGKGADKHFHTALSLSLRDTWGGRLHHAAAFASPGLPIWARRPPAGPLLRGQAESDDDATNRRLPQLRCSWF